MGEFDNLRVKGILHNWEASLLNRSFKVARVVSWTPPNGRDFEV